MYLNYLACALGGILVGAGATAAWLRWGRGGRTIASLLRRHFGAADPGQVATRQQSHPYRVAVDAYGGLTGWLAERAVVEQTIGVPVVNSFMSEIGIGSLLVPSEETYRASALEYDAFDVGEQGDRECPKHALWLLRVDGHSVAVLWTSVTEHSGRDFSTRLRIEIATPSEDRVRALSEELFAATDAAIRQSATFRGKVLSLESSDAMSGGNLGVTVHKLNDVRRDEVVLPETTVRLLDRNVIRFVDQRPQLERLGIPTKKGLLFYGPPGTGKTHTIHYLLGSLRDHTTLLVTAEQIGALAEYTALARLLQPSIVVIEDVDLIARDRGESGVCEQSLLNRLLNEMDGLREDAQVMFFLTTNRPEELESALASRPGRVDQAIEFPLPDEAGRRKLIRLYSCQTDLSDGVCNDLVRRTEGVSAAFIKELMRRATQFHLECNPTAVQIDLSQNDIDQALDELLFAGGSLNSKLLGAGDVGGD